MEKIPVILVTGASRGLGRGIAEELSRAGYSVGIHYGSNQKAADETLEKCRSFASKPGQAFHILPADLSGTQDRSTLIDRTLEAFGHLDGLVNNAGIAPRIRADIAEASEEIFDEVLAVNLKAPYFLSQKAAQYWLKNPGACRLQGGYKLAFVTSVSANTASINRGEYCIAKAALGMANQLWAVRLADAGAQVVEIRPGLMETDMTSGVKEKYDVMIKGGLIPQKRWGQPSDVGLAVRAFVEGRFPFSTGEIWNVDGGFHLRRL